MQYKNSVYWKRARGTLAENHQQAGASKLGNTINLMDLRVIEMGEFTSLKAGSNFGMFPSFVSSNGVPFRSIVLLLKRPFAGVKWYSSLCNGLSDVFCPTHETARLTPRTMELCLWLVVLIACKRLKPFSTLRMNSVWLLKLMRSSVIPGCNNKTTKAVSNS